MNKPISLFCFPYAGGNKYSYQSFIKLFIPPLNIYTLELPGRGARSDEKLLDNLELIVEDIIQQIKGRINSPYAFYGHSMGALIGYLVAKKIINMGLLEPKYLFFTGRGGPSIINQKMPRYLLSKEDFLLELEELGGIPDDVLRSSELMDFFEPVIRNDFKAIETYTYKESEKFDIPITVMTGLDEKISFDDAKAWQKETEQEIEILQFPGKHFFINKYGSEIVKIIYSRISQIAT